MPSRLRCVECEREYEPGPDEPWQCKCGHALDMVYDSLPEWAPASFAEIDTRKGIWAFDDFIPITRLISLGEGFTPEIDSSNWGVKFKLEYVSPSASFKDRGTTTMLSRALDLGVEKIVDDSSGNAGSSIAQYAAQAGLRTEIFVPADAPDAKVNAISSTGATVTPIEGSRQDVTDACVNRVDSSTAWYASHCWRPSFLAGTKTFAYEVAAQRNWSSPDVVILPLGAGTLFLGAYRDSKIYPERVG